MTLVVHSLCAYPSIGAFKEAQHDISDEHWIGFKLVSSAKGKEFKNSANISMAGVDYRIDKSSRPKTLEVFGVWGGNRLIQAKLVNASLVPVPSSSLTEFGGECTASLLSFAISSRFPQFNTEHVLCFKEARDSDHGKKAAIDGGSKGRQSKDQIYANLQCSGIPKQKRVVLIDDVCTQGRHLLACADFLRSKGCVVDLALCVGRTVWKPEGKPLSMEPFDLEADIFAFFED